MMQDKWIEVTPKDVIWDNIDVSEIENAFFPHSRLIHSNLGRSVRNTFPICYILDCLDRPHLDLVRTRRIRWYIE